MALSPGFRVGSYEIVSPLGAGGMGEVYRARDSRLNRDVALKVLPGAFADDPERLARFEREAQVLAALNHPHIATIHGIEEKDGAHALVLELVEGETLAEIIARGPLAPDQAVRIARQIADALDAAHEQGIIHRDLKPANVKLTPEGAVKVLDFGLAKLAGPSEGGPYDSGHERVGSGSIGTGFSRPDMTTSPTMATPAMLTGATVLMGTAGYMSPEQARGKPIDKRADIWAFGVVLFEMLTGRRVFEGETVTEVAGAVIHKEPDWSALSPATPPVIVMVVRRCLQKDKRQRFRDMGDVRLALDGAFTAAIPAQVAQAAAPLRRSTALVGVTALLAALAGGGGVWMMTRPEPENRPSVRFEIPPPGPKRLSPLIDISPDGRFVSFIALDENAIPRLWIRPLESAQSRILLPAEQTRFPTFWSPDGRYIGFFTDGKLKKVAVAGGPSETIADVKSFAGGTWGSDNTIVFSTGSALMRVPAAGGTPTDLIPQQGKGDMALPVMLPDGERFFYLRMTTDENTTGIYVGSLNAAPDAQDTRRIVAARHAITYVPAAGRGPGHLLFVRDSRVVAQQFDEGQLDVIGDAIPVTSDPIQTNSILASYAVSRTGTLIYIRAGASAATLSAVDRKGTVSPLLAGQTVEGENPRVSPDGRRLVVTVRREGWAYDLGGRPPVKLTFEGQFYSPLWTPDSRRIVFEKAGAARTLFSVPADGSGTSEAVGPEGHFHPHGWTADGQIIALRMGANADLVRIGMNADAKAQDVVATPASEGLAAHVSPDGQWLAYSSDQTGRSEIWVRRLDGTAAAVRVSPNGGFEPVWSRDGRELYYLENQRLMAVAIEAGGEFDFKPPTPLFSPSIARSEQPPWYDVLPDGRFVMLTTEGEPDAPISVILNWTDLLRDRAAAN